MRILHNAVLLAGLAWTMLSSDSNGDQPRPDSSTRQSPGQSGNVAIPIQASLGDFILETLVCPDKVFFEWIGDLVDGRNSRFAIICGEIGRRRLERDFALQLELLKKMP